MQIWWWLLWWIILIPTYIIYYGQKLPLHVEITVTLLQQVLSVLDPAHKRSPDIASYFCQSGGRDLVDDNDGVLPEVPLAGLRQRGGRKGGRGRGARSKCVDLLRGAKYFVHIVRCYNFQVCLKHFICPQTTSAMTPPVPWSLTVVFIILQLVFFKEFSILL